MESCHVLLKVMGVDVTSTSVSLQAPWRAASQKNSPSYILEGSPYWRIHATHEVWLPRDLLSSIHSKKIRGQRQPQSTATQDFPGEKLSKDVVTPASPIPLSPIGEVESKVCPCKAGPYPCPENNSTSLFLDSKKGT